MSITPELIKELREKTNAGILDCRRALQESGGDLERAVLYLRARGLKASEAKASRVAADGLVVARVASEGSRGVLVELNSETDFVARNDEFRSFAGSIADLILAKPLSSLEELKNARLPKGEKVTEMLNLLVSRIGEKLGIRRFVMESSQANEKIGSYVHLGDKIGVLVRLSGTKIPDAALKDIAMHIAAAHPRYVGSKDVTPDIIERERTLYREQHKDSGKPPQIVEKIIEGKISKFFSEVCLNEQVFIKDPTGKQTVSQVLKAVDPSLKVVSFHRYQVGEGIEKAASDFAAEVSKMASS